MLSRAIEIIRPCIFQVQVLTHESKFQYKRLPISLPLGTAFAVSESGLLITALHVVEEAEKILKRGGQLFAAFAGPDVDTPDMQIRAAFSGTGVKIAARDADNDIALLKLPGKLKDIVIKVGPDQLERSPRACILDLNIPADGEAIGISGYPLNEPSLVTTSGHIASRWTIYNHQDSILGDVTANPGNSGGPVYKLSNGKVIGVCVAGKQTRAEHNIGTDTQILHSAGLTFIIPAAAVNKLLQDNKSG